MAASVSRRPEEEHHEHDERVEVEGEAVPMPARRQVPTKVPTACIHGVVCRMRGWKVRNERDARGKLAQIFAHLPCYRHLDALVSTACWS